MRRLCAAALTSLILLAGCSSEPPADPSTWPGNQASQRLAGAVLPSRVAGFSALGPTPAPGLLSVTYTRDTAPFDLVVVTLTGSSDQRDTGLGDSAWYGVSRCGWLDRSAHQAACVSALLDGLMTSVGAGEIDPPELAGLANAILSSFA
ncbi:MAG: hypothetical protein LBK54_03870 [Propionibacteriaceae bacterium]|jgi:hypothetical protein|nr:hypothetical protein [Propionibacteriaceae bacterium]